MNSIFLLLALILIWITVVVGLYQRIVKMPKWFENPPVSFELIRKQNKSARAFWIPISVLFIISLILSMVLNWQFPDTRTHIIGAFICYGIASALSGSYFIKEVIAFTKIPVDEPQTPELLRRTKFWLKWTSVRDVLQILTAIFITIAYIHL